MTEYNNKDYNELINQSNKRLLTATPQEVLKFEPKQLLEEKNLKVEQF